MQAMHVKLPASCPSRSDKDAFEIAQSWVSDGYNAARQKFDDVTIKHKLNVFEAVMLAKKIAHHRKQIERHAYTG